MTEILAILSIVIVGVVFSLTGEKLFKPIKSLYRSFLFVLYSIAAGILIWLLIYYFCKKSALPLPNSGNVKYLLTGIFFGSAAIGLSSLLYIAVYRPKMHIDRFFDDFLLQLIANISPAVIEETAFRGGVVHLLSIYAGSVIGVIAGGAIFGAIHLFGALAGRIVDLWLVLGTTVAGIFLGLIYLRYGLGAAITAHWAWNCLYGSWMGILSTPTAGSRALESNWTTIIVLTVLSLCIAFGPYYILGGF